MTFRAIASVWGPEKSGKTHFALTFPEPLHFINFDYGLEDLMYQFPDKEIIPHNIGSNDPYNLDDLMGLTPRYPQLRLMLNEYTKAMKDAAARSGTVVFDTFTQARTLISDGTLEEVLESRVGKKSEGETYPFDYAKSNQITGQVIRMAYKVENVSLVLIHRAAPVYNEKGQETGRVKMQGWHEVPAAVSINIKTGRQDKRFSMTIESCRKDASLAGETYYDQMVSYDTLRDLLGD